MEQDDATREIDGWDTAGFDDSEWAPAAVIGAHPRPAPAGCAGYPGGTPCTFTRVSAVQAHIDRRVVHPVSMRRLAAPAARRRQLSGRGTGQPRLIIGTADGPVAYTVGSGSAHIAARA